MLPTVVQSPLSCIFFFFLACVEVRAERQVLQGSEVTQPLPCINIHQSANRINTASIANLLPHRKKNGETKQGGEFVKWYDSTAHLTPPGGGSSPVCKKMV